MNVTLKSLCSVITGSNDEGRVNEHVKRAMIILNSSIHDADLNPDSVYDQIKRELMRQNRLDDAVRFSGLVNKLSRSTVLKNKSSILLCLLELSKSGNQNGFCELETKQETFAFPSLHLTTNAKPSDKIFTQMKPYGAPELSDHFRQKNSAISRRSPPDTENSSFNRVAHLVSMYKGGPNPSLVESSTCQHQNSSSTRLATQKPFKKYENSTEVMDCVLLRDILFIFQGIEGHILKMTSSQKELFIDPNIRLSHNKRGIVLKLAEVGWLYCRVKNFCDPQGEGIRHNRSSCGLVNQSFVLALKDELNEFCRLIAVLESQTQENHTSGFNHSEATEGLTLRRLFMWTLEPRLRLQLLVCLIESCRGKVGGACVSALYEHLHHGDVMHSSVVQQLLVKSLTPIYIMLTHWLVEGTLEDPHQEFFVAVDPTAADNDFWHEKYFIRESMLPTFITKAQAQKILVSGKSLNFLRNVCHLRCQIDGLSAIRKSLLENKVECLLTQVDNNSLGEIISRSFSLSSHHVLEEILSRHKFVTHLRALRRYLLLGQGDFIRYLMEVLRSELDKPAKCLFPHNLSSLLETAIASSNAQFEDVDILRRLDARTLMVSPGDTGWDVFTLDYCVDGPIGTVFTKDCMQQYLQLFNSLWRAKHMEMMLSNIWKQQTASAKMCTNIPEMSGVIHRVQLVTSEMVHLMQQLAYYMTFEVMECSWHSLMVQLKSAQSLDDIIHAHREFLKRISAGALLGPESEDVLHYLRALYELIKKLNRLQENIFFTVSGEVESRKKVMVQICEKTGTGQFGTSVEEEEMEEQRKKVLSEQISSIKTDARILANAYQDMVQKFLLTLTIHDNDNLHLLSSRLDFNEFYRKRDVRLNKRLTFHHKRKSLGSAS